MELRYSDVMWTGTSALWDVCELTMDVISDLVKNEQGFLLCKYIGQQTLRVRPSEADGVHSALFVVRKSAACKDWRVKITSFWRLPSIRVCDNVTRWKGITIDTVPILKRIRQRLSIRWVNPNLPQRKFIRTSDCHISVETIALQSSQRDAQSPFWWEYLARISPSPTTWPCFPVMEAFVCYRQRETCLMSGERA